ncbi:MAG: ABC transporter permease [Christensenellales bacterium]
MTGAKDKNAGAFKAERPVKNRRAGVIDIISLALKNISTGKMRTFLTVLGLAVGTGAVMSVISLGTGGRELLDFEMNRLGTNRIWVSAEMNTGGYIELEDAKRLKQMEEATATSAVKTTYCTVSAGKELSAIKTIGCQADFFTISNLQQKAGRFINERDSQREMRTAVLNSALAKKLFASRSAVGNEISVDGIAFMVVGVVENLASSFMQNSDEEAVLYIPIETYLKDVSRLPGENAADQIMMCVSGNDVMGSAQRVVDSLARVKSGGVYRANTMTNELDIANRIMDIFLTIVGSIAVVCMIVGGIGIMNMMVSSVRERKREIGVMLAIGASPREVFFQMLAESVTMSVMGAAAGMIIGVVFTWVGCIYVGMAFSLPLWAMVTSIVFSALIGVFFGAYPAYKAARISPVEAMRS